jgi:hypothetical protein
MSKREVDSILLANKYFTVCKRCNPDCPKTELARKYLSSKIKSVLYPNKFSISKSVLSVFFSFSRAIF